MESFGQGSSLVCSEGGTRVRAQAWHPQRGFLRSEGSGVLKEVSHTHPQDLTEKHTHLPHLSLEW